MLKVLTDSLRFIVRGLWLIAHLSLGMVMVTIVRIDRERHIRPEPWTQWWNARLFGIFGLRIRIIGKPVTTGHVTVANHVSWMDISLIAACEQTRFVSKAEVERWPIVGGLAIASGTFFLVRGKGGTRPLLDKLTPFLQKGGSVTIFPEGTTSDGSGLLPFHPRLFAAAIDANLPVQPLLIRYGRTPDGRNIAPYIGDDVLFWHILAMLRNPSMDVEVRYLSPIDPAGLDRNQLAERTRNAIEAVLKPEAAAEHAATPAEAGLAAA
ncbi:lysophospholipid acyltransferase family protein [Hydrocarboniphaga sp.]|uniref:lysophospholipid acyltransferase family protein n=1 Tax=Hydrocarboniphaga sp. TaxID=2033016 RepID=UPI003D10C7A1